MSDLSDKDVELGPTGVAYLEPSGRRLAKGLSTKFLSAGMPVTFKARRLGAWPAVLGYSEPCRGACGRMRAGIPGVTSPCEKAVT